MIAIFDSGYGGMTVLKPIMELLPQYQYMYLGDNARCPYGNRSASCIQEFSEQAVEYLFARGVQLIIFACNTASSVALRHIQQKYLINGAYKDRKILGVTIPVAEKAAQSSKTGHIGVVATRATINSQVYDKEIAKINPQLTVHSQACPLLVPLIEEDWHTKPEAKMILKKYLQKLKSSHIDSLILGCTHYPLMISQFQKIMGKQVQVPCPGKVVAESLKDYLTRHPEIEVNLTKRDPKNPAIHCLTTDDPQAFKSFVEKHFGMKIQMPEKVSF